MDYRTAALQHMFRRAPKGSNNILSQVPKGWIYIKRDGTYYDTMSDSERQQHRSYLFDMEFRHQASIFTNRFLQNTMDELERDGYSPEEIQQYIENLFYEEEEQEYEEKEMEEYESDDSFNN